MPLMHTVSPQIDVAAHAGGAAFGAAFCQWLISQKRGMGILRGDRFG